MSPFFKPCGRVAGASVGGGGEFLFLTEGHWQYNGAMHVVIFEGSHWKTFAPLALGRPVFMLASGMSTLLDKALRALNPSRVSLWVRPQLEEFTRQRIAPHLKVPVTVNQPLDDEPAIVTSGRVLHFRKANLPDEPWAIIEDERLVRMAWVKSPGLSPADVLERSEAWLKIIEQPRIEPQARMVDSIWDLVHWNEESLIQDITTTLKGKPSDKPAGAYHLLNADEVWLGERVKLEPGVVLDASKGAVVISNDVSIGANSVIQGPCFLGPACQITPLTLLRPGVSAGNLCKLGGEISNSIFFGYSNKAHAGFVGDSYIGKWVNLGAGTTTSNLKNTYGEISVQIGSRTIPTGRRFLGSLIGDHSKTAIGTRLMAGSYVGFGSMISTSAPSPKFVPSMSFLTDKGIEPYLLDKAVEVAKYVFSRRGRQWNPMDEQILRHVMNSAPGVENA